MYLDRYNMVFSLNSESVFFSLKKYANAPIDPFTGVWEAHEVGKALQRFA